MSIIIIFHGRSPALVGIAVHVYGYPSKGLNLIACASTFTVLASPISCISITIAVVIYAVSAVSIGDGFSIPSAAVVVRVAGSSPVAGILAPIRHSAVPCGVARSRIA